MTLKRKLEEMDEALAAGFEAYLAKQARVESEEPASETDSAGGSEAGSEPEDVDLFPDAPGFYASAEPHLQPLLADLKAVQSLERPDPGHAEATGRLLAAARAHLGAAHLIFRSLNAAHDSAGAFHFVAATLADDAESFSPAAVDDELGRPAFDLPFPDWSKDE